MILSHEEILKEIKAKRIVVSPFDPKAVVSQEQNGNLVVSTLLFTGSA